MCLTKYRTFSKPIFHSHMTVEKCDLNPEAGVRSSNSAAHEENTFRCSEIRVRQSYYVVCPWHCRAESDVSDAAAEEAVKKPDRKWVGGEILWRLNLQSKGRTTSLLRRLWIEGGRS